MTAAANHDHPQPRPPGQASRADGWTASVWPRVAFRVLLNGLSHPFEHAKVLIQLGHEPIAPYASYTMLGQPAMALPNVFQYVAHLKRQQGFAALYRGITPKLGSNLISAVVFTKVSARLADEESDSKIDEGTQEERRRAYAKRLARDAAARVLAIVASHPLHVIAVRCMAQTVGGETKYSSWSAPIVVFQDSGVTGYFHGLAPRLLGELLTLGLTTALTFAVNYYIVDDRDVRQYLAAALSFVASAFTYPFQVVTACMAASGTDLTAVTPPNMPLYTSWWHCWKHLWGASQLSRGGGLFWRFASPAPVSALVQVHGSKPHALRRRIRFFRRKTESEEL